MLFRSYTPAPIAVWMFADVAAVMAVELENAAILGLTGDPLVVTVPEPHVGQEILAVPESTGPAPPLTKIGEVAATDGPPPLPHELGWATYADPLQR